MEEKARLILKKMGIEIDEGDPVFSFVAESVQSRLLDLTHREELPEALEPVAVNRIVGAYCGRLKATGQLTGFDFDAAVKQLHEGDTTITYAIGEGSTTPEGRFDALVSALESYGADQIRTHRRLLW